MGELLAAGSIRDFTRDGVVILRGFIAQEQIREWQAEWWDYIQSVQRDAHCRGQVGPAVQESTRALVSGRLPNWWTFPRSVPWRDSLAAENSPRAIHSKAI